MIPKSMYTKAGVTLLTAGALAANVLLAQQERRAQDAAGFETPEAIRKEHEALHAELEAAIAAGGETAAAARAVREALSAHFEEEERLAMPLLGLLEPLAAGEARASMRPAIEMAAEVRRSLDRYRDEHERIERALGRLEEVARSEGHERQERFAQRLALHAQHEEQVLYPAAILVGEHLALRLGAGGGEGARAAEASASRGGRTLLATLEPLNVRTNGAPALGSAIVRIEGGELRVDLIASGLAPGVRHRQMIHVGGACPDPSADANGDGVVDVHEGLPAYGKVLVPLDSDLGDAAAGEYPRADGAGRLRYQASVPLDALRAAVSGEDPRPDDPIVKLEPGAALELEGMTVVLHGVAEERELPESARGIAGVEPHRTVPVACGVLQRLD